MDFAQSMQPWPLSDSPVPEYPPPHQQPPPNSTPSQNTAFTKNDATLLQSTPTSNVQIRHPTFQLQEPSSAEIAYDTARRREKSPIARKPVAPLSQNPGTVRDRPFRHVSTPTHGTQNTTGAAQRQVSAGPLYSAPDPEVDGMHRNFSELSLERATNTSTPTIYLNGQEEDTGSQPEPVVQEQLTYHHERFEKPRRKAVERASFGSGSSSDGHTRSFSGSQNGRVDPSRLTLGAELYHKRGRSMTPAEVRAAQAATSPTGRSVSSGGRTPDIRPVSYVEQLSDVSYRQQMAQQNLTLDNARLRSKVGSNASLLDTKRTLDMYRANVKKTTDLKLQYEFAVFLIQMAQQSAIMQAESGSGAAPAGVSDSAELIREARDILVRCADRGYPFAQYYLADGYASGLFNRGKEDNERAFPLFVSAAKHGHAEAAYRAALCYEFGWGGRRDYAKAVQFYQQAASKSHPGAATRLGKACLLGEMGLGNRYREGIRWLKRATEFADTQHNQAPYELGVLHTTGYGDDVFKDEVYAAQLFTMAAELGHPEANLMMGEAYEYGLLNCPKDPALSIHFYTGAAQAGVPKAMMALCAWYMVGAEPVLEKDEAEAYEWARRAAKAGFPKAEYALGYFTEMGIGCRRDPLEANVWYVRAADHGDERAKQRLQVIRSAEMASIDDPTSKTDKGGTAKRKKKDAAASVETPATPQSSKEGKDDKDAKDAKDDKDCIVM